MDFLAAVVAELVVTATAAGWIDCSTAVAGLIVTAAAMTATEGVAAA